MKQLIKEKELFLNGLFGVIEKEVMENSQDQL